MDLFALEHSPAAYRLDFQLYGAVCTGLALALLVASPPGIGWLLCACVAAGLAGWTLVEYAVHRFVLHGMQPFKRWHADHHRRPTALIGSPTVLSGSLFLGLAASPAWWLVGQWPAMALMLGLLSGYLAYGLTHHATHHDVRGFRRARPWMAQRKRLHALHHHAHHANRGGTVLIGGQRTSHYVGNYGVSVALWDRVFGTRCRGSNVRVVKT